jgi:hypothetical protein
MKTEVQLTKTYETTLRGKSIVIYANITKENDIK